MSRGLARAARPLGELAVECHSCSPPRLLSRTLTNLRVTVPRSTGAIRSNAHPIAVTDWMTSHAAARRLCVANDGTFLGSCSQAHPIKAISAIPNEPRITLSPDTVVVLGFIYFPSLRTSGDRQALL